MDKILKGRMYSKDGKYMVIYFNGDLENLAAFIARCPSSNKVVVENECGDFVMNTIGNYIDKIDGEYMKYRLDLLDHLIPMQTCEKEIPNVDFIYDPYEYSGASKEEFIQAVEKYTNYKLEGQLY